MNSDNRLTLQIFFTAIFVVSCLFPARAPAAVGDAARNLSPVSLSAAIARITPKEERDTPLLLTLGNDDNARYSPSLRSQLHHAEGSAVPHADSIGLDPTTLSLELRQPLYRNGQSRAQTQAADSRLRADIADKLLHQQDRNLLIINNYIDALSLEAQSRLLSGFSMTKQRIDHSYKKARKLLEQRAGIDAGTPLEDIASPALFPASLQSALALAEENHPAIIRAHYRCAAAEAGARSLDWEDAPDIDLRGGLDRTVDSYGNNRADDSGIIGLRATIPLRSDSERKSMLVQAREEAQSSRLNIDTARLDIRQKVIAAWDEATRARAEERFQTRKAELAEGAQQGRLPEHSKLHGMGSNDAFATLAQEARLAAVAAHYQTLKAEFAVLAATGQLNQALGAPSPRPADKQNILVDLQNADRSADLSIK